MVAALNKRTNNVGRAKRYNVKDHLPISAKTMGSHGKYSMWTKNVSETGLLIAAEKSEYVPFIVNTIIELEVDANATILPEPVRSMGKVVRVDESFDGFTIWGVRIIQIDLQDQINWEKCVRYIAQLANRAVE